MPDFRVADTAPEHPKLRAAGLAAVGLWATAGAYAMRELTDGWVPEYWVLTWPSGKANANKLITVGLWRKETRKGIAGFGFHDWAEYQRPAEKIHEERRKGRERAQRSRERSGVRAGEASALPVDNDSNLRGSKNTALAPNRSRKSHRNSTADSGLGSPVPAEMVDRSGERSGEVTADVRSVSHDSLPLSLTTSGPDGHLGAGSERANEQRAPQHQRLPSDWTPHLGHRKTATRRHLDLDHEAAQFRAHAQANGRTLVDWDAGFDVWLGRARPEQAAGVTPIGRRSTTDDRMAQAQALKSQMLALPGGA